MKKKTGSLPLLTAEPTELLKTKLQASRQTTALGDYVPPGAHQKRRVSGLFQDGSELKGNGICRNHFCKWIVSHIAVIHWLPQYDFRANLFSDFAGGTTIALICLVQTLAHAAIATTSVIQGPYCAFVPPFVYAILGTSPHASISSGAIAAILIADQLRDFDDIDKRTQLASLLALFSGILLVVMGLCKAAYAMRFLSQSLLSGFITGGSVLIIIGQMANLLGIVGLPHTPDAKSTVLVLAKNIHKTNLWSLGLGVMILSLLQVMMWTKKALQKRAAKKDAPQWVSVGRVFVEMKELVLVVLSTFFAWVTSDAEHNTLMPCVGTIHPGLPPLDLPWASEAAEELWTMEYTFRHFVLGSGLVAITTFLTTYTTSKKQALLHGYELDANKEMFALGMAGSIGSFFGTFPPSGSLSRTSLASEVGVKSQMSGLMQILVVGGSLMYLTPVLYYLPKATLAGIILRSTWSLVDTDMAKKLYRQWKPRAEGGHKRDMVVWCIAFLLTIWKGVLYGIGSAVLVSLFLIVKDASRPRVVVLGKLVDKDLWRDKDIWHECRTEKGVLVVEFRGPLSFASADWFQEELERIRIQTNEKELGKLGGQEIEFIVLAFGSVHDLDPTALKMLHDLLSAWKRFGVSCVVADAKARVRLLLEEHFAKAPAGKAPLLDQPAFMINLDDAAAIAHWRFKMKHSQNVISAATTDDIVPGKFVQSVFR